MNDLFHKVRVTLQKKLYDGLSLEPGSVLRVDDQKQIGTHSTATFMCLLYISLKPPHRMNSGDGDVHPIRSMLQMLYPYASTHDKDSPPSFCKDSAHDSKNIMYIPQLWAVVIGSSTIGDVLRRNRLTISPEYIITCAEASVDDIVKPSIDTRKQEPMEADDPVHAIGILLEFKNQHFFNISIEPVPSFFVRLHCIVQQNLEHCLTNPGVTSKNSSGVLSYPPYLVG